MQNPVVKFKLPGSPLALPCKPGEVEEFLSRPSERTLETLRANPGKILVLGAGGKMGLHTSAMLRRGLQALGSKDSVVAVSRFKTLHDRNDFTQFGIETLACDLEDDEALSRLPEAPIIFFLAGVKFGTADAPGLLKRLNEEMPRKVASRFKSSKFVAFSTGCVYPFVSPSSGGATESLPPNPPGEYAKSCIERENVFRAAAVRYGTQSALIRLNYSVEFRYGLLVDIALKVYRSEPIDITMGYANVIWQGDAVNYSIQALELAASPAVPVNVTGPDIFSVETIAEWFGDYFGKSPVFTGRTADTAWLNNASFLYKKFGRPTVSLESMLHWVATWVTNDGELWGKPTGFENRDGKF